MKTKNLFKTKPFSGIAITLVGMLAVVSGSPVHAKGKALTSAFNKASGYSSTARTSIAASRSTRHISSGTSYGSLSRSTTTTTSTIGSGAGSMARMSTGTSKVGIGQGTMANSWSASKSNNVIQGGKITGYTRHGLNQVIGRNGGKGVNARTMLQAVRSPKKVSPGRNGAMKYQGQSATVILTDKGKVVTAYGASRGPRIWREGTKRRQGSGPAQRKANKLGFSYIPPKK